MRILLNLMFKGGSNRSVTTCLAKYLKLFVQLPFETQLHKHLINCCYDHKIIMEGGIPQLLQIKLTNQRLNKKGTYYLRLTNKE